MYQLQKWESDRAAVIEEAKTWLRTPFLMGNGLKGVGVDCFRLIEAVYRTTGVLVGIDVSDYQFPTDWFLNTRTEIYLAGLEAHCRNVRSPLPGDVAVFQFGRIYSHAGIVVDWPTQLIHAWKNGVEWVNASQAPLMGRHPLFYSPFK